MAVMADWGTAAYTGRGTYAQKSPLLQSHYYSDQYEDNKAHQQYLASPNYNHTYSSSGQHSSYASTPTAQHSYGGSSYASGSRDYDYYQNSAPSPYLSSPYDSHHHHDDANSYSSGAGGASQRYHFHAGSSSQDGLTTSQDEAAAEEGGGMNMAGFGARKLAEQSRHRAAAENAARRQQEERIRWEQEQKAWEAEQQAYYDAQARQRQWEEEEAARQARAQSQSAAAPDSNDDAYGDHDYHEPPPAQSNDHAARSPSDHQRSQQARRSRAAQQWYAQEETSRQPPSSSRQHRHLPSASSSRGADASATRQRHHVKESYSSDISQLRDDGLTSTNQSLDVPGPTLDSVASPARNLARETIYEDDFEEAEEELAANFSRYTCYEGTADTNLASPRGAWSGARKSLFQATTDQPLPLARCADCGESFTFEQLTDHACEQASLPPTPTLALTPVSSLAPLSATKQEDKQPRSGSPFLDRYDELAARKKSGNGGGSAPRSPLLAHLGGPTRSASTDERSRSRENGRLGLGLTVGDEMQRSQTSPLGSPLSEMGKQEQQQRDGSRGQGSGPSPTSASASASSTSAELRKRIEAQRAAKRQNSGLSPSLDSPTATFKQLELEKSPSKLGATPEKLSPLIRSKEEVQLANARSGASVSSSLGTPASSLLAPGSSPVGLALTPSSSVDRFSDYAKDSSPPPPLRDDLLSPKSAQLAWDRMTTQERSVCITEARKQQRGGGDTPGAGTRSLPRSPRLGGKSPKTRDIDLGGIEDLLKDLETSDVVPIRLAKDASSSTSKVRSEKPVRRGPPTPLKLGSMNTSKPSSSSSRKKSSRSTKLCCICMCSLNSSKGRFVEKDGKYFCADDYKQLYLPKCTKCRQPVEKDAVKSRDGALKGVFHRSCFNCFHCDARFEDGIFFVYENAPYCFDHYSLVAGTSCASCGSGIEGTCRQTESGERYHPHCLTCQFENHKTGEFCMDVLDDFYILMGRRLCEHHAQKVQMMMNKVGKKQAKAEKRRTMLKKLA